MASAASLTPWASPQGAQFKVPGWVKDVGREAWDFAKDNAVAIGAGITSYAGQQSTNAANAKMAREQMEFQERMAGRQESFQERMSNSAVQRHVADLKAAGLNPALAFSSAGASTPTGSTASGAMAHAENAAAGGVSSGLAASQLKSNIRLTRAQEENVRVQAQKTNQDWFITDQTMGDIRRRINAEANSAEQANRTSKALEEQYRASTRNILNEGARIEAEANMWRSAIGKSVLPWLNAASGASSLFRAIPSR